MISMLIVVYMTMIGSTNHGHHSGSYAFLLVLILLHHEGKQQPQNRIYFPLRTWAHGMQTHSHPHERTHACKCTWTHTHSSNILQTRKKVNICLKGWIALTMKKFLQETTHKWKTRGSVNDRMRNYLCVCCLHTLWYMLLEKLYYKRNFENDEERERERENGERAQ